MLILPSSLSAGELLPELITSLVLLQLRAPTVLNTTSCFPMLTTLLDILDSFNKLAPGLALEDNEDLAWPGVWGMLHSDIMKKY